MDGDVRRHQRGTGDARRYRQVASEMPAGLQRDGRGTMFLAIEVLWRPVERVAVDVIVLCRLVYVA